MTSLFDSGIAPGRLHLPTPEAFDAYWAKCESAIIEAQIQQLAHLPCNEDRADYFEWRSARILLIDDPAEREHRLVAVRRLKRMVWSAMRECQAG